MQAVNKGSEKLIQELANAESDGPVSETFCKVFKQSGKSLSLILMNMDLTPFF